MLKEFKKAKHQDRGRKKKKRKKERRLKKEREAEKLIERSGFMMLYLNLGLCLLCTF